MLIKACLNGGTTRLRILIEAMDETPGEAVATATAIEAAVRLVAEPDYHS